MPETIYGLATDDLACNVLDGEAVLLDLGSGHYFGLNATGTALWQVLEGGPRSVRTLAQTLAEAHGRETDELVDDVAWFLRELVECGLVGEVDGAEVAAGEIIVEGPYLAPVIERYDKLDDLLLSGE